jgi:hypothetical protein
MDPKRIRNQLLLSIPEPSFSSTRNSLVSALFWCQHCSGVSIVLVSAFPLASAFFWHQHCSGSARILQLSCEISLRFCGIIENDTEYIRASRDAKSSYPMTGDGISCGHICYAAEPRHNLSRLRRIDLDSSIALTTKIASVEESESPRAHYSAMYGPRRRMLRPRRGDQSVAAAVRLLYTPTKAGQKGTILKSDRI